MAAVHEERFIPERHKLDQVSIVKDYAAVPRLEYRYVLRRDVSFNLHPNKWT